MYVIVPVYVDAGVYAGIGTCSRILEPYVQTIHGHVQRFLSINTNVPLAGTYEVIPPSSTTAGLPAHAIVVIGSALILIVVFAIVHTLLVRFETLIVV